jgi:hypothetical protein
MILSVNRTLLPVPGVLGNLRILEVLLKTLLDPGPEASSVSSGVVRDERVGSGGGGGSTGAPMRGEGQSDKGENWPTRVTDCERERDEEEEDREGVRAGREVEAVG